MKLGLMFTVTMLIAGVSFAQEKGESPKKSSGLVKPIVPATPVKSDKGTSSEKAMTKEDRLNQAKTFVMDKSTFGPSLGDLTSSLNRGEKRGGSQGPSQGSNRQQQEVEISVQIGGFHGAYRRDQNRFRRELLLAPGEYVDFGRNRVVCDDESNYYQPSAFQCSAQVCTNHNNWSDPCFFCDSDDYWTKTEVGSTIESARESLTQNVGCWRPSTLRCSTVN